MLLCFHKACQKCNNHVHVLCDRILLQEFAHILNLFAQRHTLCGYNYVHFKHFKMKCTLQICQLRDSPWNRAQYM